MLKLNNANLHENKFNKISDSEHKTIKYNFQ